mgnify:CR=1 FL=1
MDIDILYLDVSGHEYRYYVDRYVAISIDLTVRKVDKIEMWFCRRAL